MRRGTAGRGSSDRAPIAVTQRGEADVKAAMRAQGSRDRPNVLRLCQSGDRGVGWASVQECHQKPSVLRWLLVDHRVKMPLPRDTTEFMGTAIFEYQT